MATSTIIRKNLMALTGLFLCVFLVVHLAGNLQLLLPPDRAELQFNLYSKILSGNLIIKVISWLLFLSIIAHSVYALIITLRNRRSAGGAYAYDRRGSASRWYSRNMGVLGSIILIFLIIHLKDFWYVYSFGSLPMDADGNKNLFAIVVSAFGTWWYVALNVLAFLALGYHLIHGFNSAFKSLGVYSPKLSRIVYFGGIAFSVIITAGFVFIPIYVFLTYHN